MLGIEDKDTLQRGPGSGLCHQPVLGTQGPRAPAQTQPTGSTHQANEVGTPSITQQVGQHNLEGLSSGASCGDHHVLGGEGAGSRGGGQGQGSAEAEVRDKPQF